MKLKFLGTAAAEGVPAVFCNCPTCMRAKARGGKEIRTRSQILIDNDTLFDFPMDTYMHMLNYKLDLSAIKRVLITHSHMDHCYPQEFCMRGAPFAHGMIRPEMTVYCNSTVREAFIHDTSREMRPEISNNIRLEVVQPYDEIFSDDMRIIALPAVHTAGEDCLIYYIERAGAGVLLMNDTGVLDVSVFEQLKSMRVAVGLVAFDCTYGAKKHGPGRHMGLYDIVEQRELMDKTGLLASDAVFYATHFSHNTDLDFEGMVRAASPYGINIAYDGCEVRI